MRLLFLLLLFPLQAIADPYPADPKAIVAVVDGVNANEGEIVGSLFDSKKAYMKTPLATVNVKVAATPEVLLDFGVHPPGDYSIVVFYDINANGKLDTGLFRIPTEEIGYSNNARGRFGPAKWKKTKFTLADDVRIGITLHSAKK